MRQEGALTWMKQASAPHFKYTLCPYAFCTYIYTGWIHYSHHYLPPDFTMTKDIIAVHEPALIRKI
jgi:hypothetical protein